LAFPVSYEAIMEKKKEKVKRNFDFLLIGFSRP
jgi:hypothetical protein